MTGHRPTRGCTARLHDGHLVGRAVGREPDLAAGAWCCAAWVVALVVLALSGCSCERPREAWMPKEMPLVRVKLGDDARTVSVSVDGPWRLVGADGDIAAGRTLDWTAVQAAGSGIAFGAVATTDGPVELHPADGVPVCIDLPKRKRCRYRGFLRFLPTPGGEVRVVNVLPMEMYVAGVVGREMPASWHVEALKAQAVAARTYVLGRRNARARYDFDLFDTQMSQVYGGLDAETERTRQAVRETAGVVATYESGGRSVLLPAYYHSTCGGDTVAAGMVFGGATPPPLVGGTRCTYCRESPRYRWKDEVVLSKAEITEAMHTSSEPALRTLGPVVRVEVASRAGESGRAVRIRLVDADGRSVLVRASTWRLLVGGRKVPSTWFWVEDREDVIALVHGRGFGHGVGLCQYGAQFLASHGQKAEQILRYYYPGVVLERAY